VVVGLATEGRGRAGLSDLAPMVGLVGDEYGVGVGLSARGVRRMAMELTSESLGEELSMRVGACVAVGTDSRWVAGVGLSVRGAWQCVWLVVGLARVMVGLATRWRGWVGVAVGEADVGAGLAARGLGLTARSEAKREGLAPRTGVSEEKKEVVDGLAVGGVGVVGEAGRSKEKKGAGLAVRGGVGLTARGVGLTARMMDLITPTKGLAGRGAGLLGARFAPLGEVGVVVVVVGLTRVGVVVPWVAGTLLFPGAVAAGAGLAV
jgi:hypothetical protein